MSKEVVEQLVKHFNNRELEKLNKLWHDDIQIIRLMTNDVVIDGKDQLIEANKPYLDEGKVNFEIRNIVELGNIVLTFSELVGLELERVTISEVIDGKVKRSWISQFPKDKEK